MGVVDVRGEADATATLGTHHAMSHQVLIQLIVAHLGVTEGHDARVATLIGARDELQMGARAYAGKQIFRVAQDPALDLLDTDLLQQRQARRQRVDTEHVGAAAFETPR